MSPGSLTERISLFMARLHAGRSFLRRRRRRGEGEDIEVLEMPLDEALAMIGSGEIVDAKTIILLRKADRARLAGG